MDPESEGPAKYPPYICLFVCLSICLFLNLFRVFLQKSLEELSDFLHGVRRSFNLKSDSPPFVGNSPLYIGFSLTPLKIGLVTTRFRVQYNQYIWNFSYFVYWFHGPLGKLKKQQKMGHNEKIGHTVQVKSVITSLAIMNKNIYFLLIHHL